MRHDSRPEDANRHEQGTRRQGGPQTGNHAQHIGLRLEHLDQETAADGRHQHQDHGLHLPHPPALKVQERERVKRRNQTAPEEWQPEEQLQGDDRTQHFRQVRCRNCDLGQDPENQIDPGRILGPACLGQVVSRHHPQPSSQSLQQNGHQVGHQKHPDQRITEPGAPLEIGGPVAWVHVAHAYQIGRPQEREKPAQFLPPSSRRRNINRSVDLFQGFPIRTRPPTTAMHAPHDSSFTGNPGHPLSRSLYSIRFTPFFGPRQDVNPKRSK